MITQPVCEGLRRSAARALPGEAGGVLVGRDRRYGWTDPYHVGIVAYARPAYGEWARVSVGPEGLPAWPVSRMAVEVRPGDSGRRRRVTGTGLYG